VTPADHRTYQLRVGEHLDDRWATWFDGFALASYADGTCTLTGEVADQAQLHGILARLRDLGVTLVSLRALDAAGLPLDACVRLSSADPARDHGGRPRVGC